MPFRAPVLPLLLVVLGLVGAPVAAAQTATTTTFGSPLENAPNVGPGCEARPWVASDLDSLTLTASGQPSCTWMQLGQFGVQADTRRGNAPGNGRITAVEVRSGPNPAPFRVTVLRQITAQSQNGSLGGTLSVASGATLKGNGTVGSTVVEGGALVAPGNSIGTLTIDGDYVQGATGVYAAELAPGGRSDRLHVTGTATLALP